MTPLPSCFLPTEPLTLTQASYTLTRIYTPTADTLPPSSPTARKRLIVLSGPILYTGRPPFLPPLPSEGTRFKGSAGSSSLEITFDLGSKEPGGDVSWFDSFEGYPAPASPPSPRSMAPSLSPRRVQKSSSRDHLASNSPSLSPQTPLTRVEQIPHTDASRSKPSSYTSTPTSKRPQRRLPPTRSPVPKDFNKFSDNDPEDEDEDEDLVMPARDLGRARESLLMKRPMGAGLGSSKAYVPPNMGYASTSTSGAGHQAGSSRVPQRKIQEIPSEDDVEDENRDDSDAQYRGDGAHSRLKSKRPSSLFWGPKSLEGDSGEMGDTEIGFFPGQAGYEDEDEDEMMEFDDDLETGSGSGRNGKRGLSDDVKRMDRSSAMERLKRSRQEREQVKVALQSKVAKGNRPSPQRTIRHVRKPMTTRMGSTAAAGSSGSSPSRPKADRPGSDRADNELFDEDDAMLEQAAAIAEREAARAQRTSLCKGDEVARAVGAALELGKGSEYGPSSQAQPGLTDSSARIPWSMTPPKSDERDGTEPGKMKAPPIGQSGMSWMPTSTAQKRKELEGMFEDDEHSPEGSGSGGGGPAGRDETYYSAMENSDRPGRRERGGSDGRDRGRAGASAEDTPNFENGLTDEPDFVDLDDDIDDDGFMGPMGTQDAGTYDDINLAQALDDVIELDDDDEDHGDDGDFDEYWCDAPDDGYYAACVPYVPPGLDTPLSRASGSFVVPALPPRSDRTENTGPMIHPIKTISSLSPELQDFYLHHWCRSSARNRGEASQSVASRQEEQVRFKEREALANKGRRSSGGRGGGSKAGRGRSSWRGFRGRGRGKR